ncbi:MAG: sulfite exporter TauE/SafE family protein [Anaerolineae bacterium]|nr:sulfite exporter TauE/SafE family protein [Anaerolineae bacterium]
MLPDQVNIGLAFLAGMASFLAPCVLPLVPAYLSYLSGYTVGSSGSVDAKTRSHIVMHALSFVLGFTIVFVLLGTAAGALGRWVRGDWLRYLGGALMILFGLTLAGALHISLFDRQSQLSVKRRADWGYASSLLTGLAFGAGWTPCVGPVLSSILVLSADQATLLRGLLLLLAYSAGMGIPFILAALLVDRAGKFIRKLAPYQPVIQKVTGVLIILVGIILITDSFASIGLWLEERGLGWDLGL